MQLSNLDCTVLMEFDKICVYNCKLKKKLYNQIHYVHMTVSSKFVENQQFDNYNSVI